MSLGWARIVAGAAMVAALVGCTGCTNLGYYWQAATGHIDLMRAARPVPEWLQDPQASQALKDKLLLAQRIRHYASAELALPDNRSYTAYADLRRPAAPWNVVGAPQSQHLAMVFAVSEMAGWLTPPAEAVHVPFGNVLGADRKMLYMTSHNFLARVRLKIDGSR